MSACERCWSDAHHDPCLEVADEYKRLMGERKGDKACTAEQQAGPDAGECHECAGRRVLHQHTGECMVNPHHGEYGEEVRDRQYAAAKAQGAAEATAAAVKLLRSAADGMRTGDTPALQSAFDVLVHYAARLEAGDHIKQETKPNE